MMWHFAATMAMPPIATGRAPVDRLLFVVSFPEAQFVSFVSVSLAHFLQFSWNLNNSKDIWICNCTLHSRLYYKALTIDCSGFMWYWMSDVVDAQWESRVSRRHYIFAARIPRCVTTRLWYLPDQPLYTSVAGSQHRQTKQWKSKSKKKSTHTKYEKFRTRFIAVEMRETKLATNTYTDHTLHNLLTTCRRLLAARPTTDAMQYICTHNRNLVPVFAFTVSMELSKQPPHIQMLAQNAHRMSMPNANTATQTHKRHLST